MIYYQYMGSPIGKLLMAGDEKGLHLINFPRNGESSLPETHWQEDPTPFRKLCISLKPIFTGN